MTCFLPDDKFNVSQLNQPSESVEIYAFPMHLKAFHINQLEKLTTETVSKYREINKGRMEV